MSSPILQPQINIKRNDNKGKENRKIQDLGSSFSTAIKDVIFAC